MVKIRLGFVSNSSNTSFIIPMQYFTPLQKAALGRMSYIAQYALKWEGREVDMLNWEFEEIADQKLIFGYIDINAGDIHRFLIEIGVDITHLWYFEHRCGEQINDLLKRYYKKFSIDFCDWAKFRKEFTRQESPHLNVQLDEFLSQNELSSPTLIEDINAQNENGNKIINVITHQLYTQVSGKDLGKLMFIYYHYQCDEPPWSTTVEYIYDYFVNRIMWLKTLVDNGLDHYITLLILTWAGGEFDEEPNYLAYQVAFDELNVQFHLVDWNLIAQLVNFDTNSLTES